MLLKHIKTLEKIVGEAYKPKKELQEITAKIVMQAERLQTSDMEKWVEDVSTDTCKENETQKQLQYENQNLKEQIHLMNNEYQNNMRCDECEKVQRRMTRRSFLKKEETFEYFEQVTEQDWEDEVFTRIGTEVGNIWEAPTDMDIALPCDTSIRSGHKRVMAAINKLGGITGLRSQNKKEGEIAFMAHSLGFPDEDGNITFTSRNIHYTIVADENSTQKNQDENVFNSLHTLKNYMLKHMKKNLIIPELDGIEQYT